MLKRARRLECQSPQKGQIGVRELHEANIGRNRQQSLENGQGEARSGETGQATDKATGETEAELTEHRQLLVRQGEQHQDRCHVDETDGNPDGEER